VAESALAEPGFNAAVVIPVYNHKDAIGPTLARVLEHGYPVLLVDDGCDAECRDELIRLSRINGDGVKLLCLEQNGGKGAAVKAGLQALREAGFSHAVQIDADGQHDLDDLPRFIQCSRAAPRALVTGYPQYDASVPALRYYARYLTHIWVWINTLSLVIKDAMCGFRVYPLEQVVELLECEPCGNRMDFDPEVIVRWTWRGYPVVNLPTRVHYPLDGVSHFNAVKDNVLISGMHARLFFGMLWRLPVLIWKRLHG
jgi:glycosyltransferase involved in cell wall biosynthesis